MNNLRRGQLIAPFLILMGISAAPAQDAARPGFPPSLRIQTRVAFTEGPAWHPDGWVYFTDIKNSRIMRQKAGDGEGDAEVFRKDSGRANGLAFHGGRLHACEGARSGGNRRVTRTESDGRITVLADRFEGKRLNSPNDLCFDSRGRLYFSDPRYGDRADMQQRDRQGREIEGVYRIDPDGSVTRIITHEVHRPNGLAVTADDRFLFVADNVNDGPKNGVGGARKLWRFALTPKGTIAPSSRTLIFDWGTDRGPDGMVLSPGRKAGEQKLYVAAGFNFPSPPAETTNHYKAGIYIFKTTGMTDDLQKNRIGFLPVPEDMITNCTFGGPDHKTLFITAGHKLWSVRP